MKSQGFNLRNSKNKPNTRSLRQADFSATNSRFSNTAFHSKPDLVYHFSL
jgi:hypothetical protein